MNGRVAADMICHATEKIARSAALTMLLTMRVTVCPALVEIRLLSVAKKVKFQIPLTWIEGKKSSFHEKRVGNLCSMR